MIHCLDGTWDFQFAENDSSLPERYEDIMPVPGCFDVAQSFSGKRGIGFYRTEIELANDANHRLVFDGVAHNTSVYVDGNLLVKHHGAFTGFCVDLSDLSPGKHELVIGADNRLDGLNSPLHMDHFDWYSFGGIIRSVHLWQWTDTVINRLNPVVEDWSTGRLRLQVDYQMSDKARNAIPVQVSFRNTVLYQGEFSASANHGEACFVLPDPKPWTPDEPFLYELDIRLGDDLRKLNVALRDIKVQGNQILLNDQPVRIRGINRHDIHVDYGFALPLATTFNDVQRIKQLGCNFVRTSHYPPSHAFLDLCDQLGLMVWCESTGWGYDSEMLTDKRLIEAQQQCVRDMVEQYAHHPSIVCWGLLNECASHLPATRPLYESLFGIIRELDPTRPVTYASNKFPSEDAGLAPGEKDLMFDLADIVSINTYPGWYGGDLEDCGDLVDSLRQSLIKAGLGEKPCVISEIGAGAIPGFDRTPPVKWSLSYQKQLLVEVLERIRIGGYAGVCIWQFCDIPTSDVLWSRRPRGYNNKGIFDEYRRAKPAVDAVREVYSKPW